MFSDWVGFKVHFTRGGFVRLIGETDRSVHLRFFPLRVVLIPLTKLSNGDDISLPPGSFVTS